MMPPTCTHPIRFGDLRTGDLFRFELSGSIFQKASPCFYAPFHPVYRKRCSESTLVYLLGA